MSCTEGSHGLQEEEHGFWLSAGELAAAVIGLQMLNESMDGMFEAEPSLEGLEAIVQLRNDGRRALEKILD